MSKRARTSSILVSLLALGVGALATSGCATQAEIQGTQRDIQNTRSVIADTQSRLNAMQTEIDRLRGQVEQLQFSGGAGASLEELVRRLETLEARVAALEDPFRTGGEPYGGPTRPGQPFPPSAESPVEMPSIPSDAPAEYRDGVEALRAGQSQVAIQRLREFLRRSPKSELADDAQYWIGEAYFATRDYNRAILEFNEVLLRYPRGNRVAASLLRQAFAFAELGDRVDARLVLQKLLSEHPDTPEARIGRQKLEELGSS